MRTSLDDGQQFGRPAPVDAIAELSDALASEQLSQITLQDGTSDLILHFGKLSFEAINSSSGYEAWQLSGPGTFLVVALGGGSLAVWG